MKVFFIFQLLFVFSLLAEKPKIGVKVLVPGEEDCHKAEDGDILFITHEGFAVDQMGQRSQQFDANGGEPLEVHIGKPGLIRGLLMGLKGVCKDEVRVITIPPTLAFDDKKVFPYGPPEGIPSGLAVQYEITAVDLVEKDTLRGMYYPVVRSIMKNLFGIIGMLLIFGVLGFLGYSVSKLNTSEAPKKKEKKKKK